MAHYALGGMKDRVLVARYQTALPSEEKLAEELRRVQQALSARGTSPRSTTSPPASTRPREKSS